MIAFTLPPSPPFFLVRFVLDFCSCVKTVYKVLGVVAFVFFCYLYKFHSLVILIFAPQLGQNGVLVTLILPCVMSSQVHPHWSQYVSPSWYIVRFVVHVPSRSADGRSCKVLQISSPYRNSAWFGLSNIADSASIAACLLIVSSFILSPRFSLTRSLEGSAYRTNIRNRISVMQTSFYLRTIVSFCGRNAQCNRI